MAAVQVLYALCRRYHDGISRHRAHRRKCAVSSFHTISVAKHTTTDIRKSAPFFLSPITNAIAGSIESKFLEPNFKNNFDFLEKQMSSSPNNGKYLCGSELSGADFIMSFPLSAAKSRAGLTQQKYPHLWAYIERYESTESYTRAVKKIIEIEGAYDPTL